VRLSPQLPQQRPPSPRTAPRPCSAHEASLVTPRTTFLTGLQQGARQQRFDRESADVLRGRSRGQQRTASPLEMQLCRQHARQNLKAAHSRDAALQSVLMCTTTTRFSPSVSHGASSTSPPSLLIECKKPPSSSAARCHLTSSAKHLRAASQGCTRAYHSSVAYAAWAHWRAMAWPHQTVQDTPLRRRRVLLQAGSLHGQTRTWR